MCVYTICNNFWSFPERCISKSEFFGTFLIPIVGPSSERDQIHKYYCKCEKIIVDNEESTLVAHRVCCLIWVLQANIINAQILFCGLSEPNGVFSSIWTSKGRFMVLFKVCRPETYLRSPLPCYKSLALLNTNGWYDTVLVDSSILTSIKFVISNDVVLL